MQGGKILAIIVGYCWKHSAISVENFDSQKLEFSWILGGEWRTTVAYICRHRALKIECSSNWLNWERCLQTKLILLIVIMSGKREI